MAFVDREFARELFHTDADPDLPGHTDAAQIFAADFKLESNAICFNVDSSMNPLSESHYNVVDFRTVTNIGIHETCLPLTSHSNKEITPVILIPFECY